ncbi:MAG: polysaccharide deacetylase family protein [Leptolyngbya sp. UWPOB_LEPTO1]|uniref:chitin deacetylase family protein n=1 Tax=Leptolyngbya sp. UWPOB_LEPTO1 TaxID=2815653 RepID=UPI001ACDCA21|nr:chitin deacetylase family protein [Leptolyngbya sp. UWPOB_LEPTO1]MBN8560628.1 polysaccharide deacetylase family protein [Leptolyngbya sp. UWPOB_LEPTO1]
MFYSQIFLISLELLLGLIVVLLFQPRWLLRIIEKLSPGVTYFFKTQERIVALSIDDGLDPATTPKILSVLEKHQVHATFFLISSRVEPNPELITELLDRGHEVGNHLTQDEPSVLLSEIEFEAAVIEAENILSKYTRPKWLRPGGGWYKKSTIDIAQKHGYRVVLGDIFPYDTHIPSSWFASLFILCKIRPGSIIILHDTGMWGKRTATTLEKILPILDRQGYRVVPLSELARSS